MRFAATLCLAISALASAPVPSHADFRHFSSRLLKGGGREWLSALAVNGAGDLFIAAYVDTFISFGGDPVGPGSVIAKLNAAGDQVWAGTLLEYPLAVAGTGDGGVVVTGDASPDNMFLLKLDATGTLQWQHTYGFQYQQEGKALAVDPSGNIIVTGSNWGTVDFGGGIIRANGGGDVFLAKFDGSGAHVWSRGFGNGLSQEGVAVATGPYNEIALVCSAAGIDFGDSVVEDLGNGDVMAGMFDENGNHLWTEHAGTRFSERAFDVALDAAGNTFLCGRFTQSIDLGGGLITTPTGSSTSQNGFVVSYDPTGAFRWNYAISDTIASDAGKLDLDGFGNCFVLAHNASTLVIDDQILSPGTLLLGLDLAGTAICAGSFSRYLYDSHIAIDRTGDRIHLAADTNMPVDFGGGVLQPVGRSDVALATLGVRRPPRVTISNFAARNTGAAIEVRWDIASGEPLGGYSLSRQVGGSADAQILTFGPATDGAHSYVDDAIRPGHIYTYRLKVATALGDEKFSNTVSINVPSATTSLGQNSPNPFNPLTTFPYTLAAPAQVSIAIYDLSGALIAKLEQGMQRAGRHEAKWAGHNWEGNLVSSGVYFYRLEGAGDIPARKMVLLK